MTECVPEFHATIEPPAGVTDPPPPPVDAAPPPICRQKAFPPPTPPPVDQGNLLVEVLPVVLAGLGLAYVLGVFTGSLWSQLPDVEA